MFNEYLQYLQTPAIILSIFGSALGSAVFIARKIGGLETQFSQMLKQVDMLTKVTEQLNNCVNEMQVILKQKFDLKFDQKTLNMYGSAHSPLVLREEFKPLIRETGLADEVRQQEKKLTAWLRAKKPQTGLDAQDEITQLVLTNEIEEYLDTRKLKDKIYQMGRSTEDYQAIVAIYLFETIIPKVIKSPLK